MAASMSRTMTPHTLPSASSTPAPSATLPPSALVDPSLTAAPTIAAGIESRALGIVQIKIARATLKPSLIFRHG